MKRKRQESDEEQSSDDSLFKMTREMKAPKTQGYASPLFLNYQHNSGFNCSDIGMYVLLNWSMVAGYEELPRGFLAR